MADKFSVIFDATNPREKSRAIAQVGAMQGVCRLEGCRYRPRRSDRQNRYYWPVFVSPFAEYMREHGNEFESDQAANDAAHEILKAKFLKVRIIDKQTGQEFVFVRSTTTLTTVEFNNYLDRCARFLAEECHIVVPEPSIYREPLDTPKSKSVKESTAA